MIEAARRAVAPSIGVRRAVILRVSLMNFTSASARFSSTRRPVVNIGQKCRCGTVIVCSTRSLTTIALIQSAGT